MKNKNLNLIPTLLITLTLPFIAFGQQQSTIETPEQPLAANELVTVKGTVTTSDQYHVNNVEVTARKANARTCTDSDGKFEITAPHGDVLIFKANGFEKIRRGVTPFGEEININMNLKPGEKNERLAVIYGHMTAEAVAYAVEHYRRNYGEFLRYSNMAELLRSELVGTRVTDHGNIRVFVKSSDFASHGMSEREGAASFILDGMIVDNIDFLNPMDVKSVTLVKDAAGAGIYGSRGANGVVLINTK
jgi:TonB-dependent SusC/RagA subfamily outer membrane receptor